jgi:hypothetical protein
LAYSPLKNHQYSLCWLSHHDTPLPHVLHILGMGTKYSKLSHVQRYGFRGLLTVAVFWSSVPTRA